MSDGRNMLINLISDMEKIIASEEKLNYLERFKKEILRQIELEKEKIEKLQKHEEKVFETLKIMKKNREEEEEKKFDNLKRIYEQELQRKEMRRNKTQEDVETLKDAFAEYFAAEEACAETEIPYRQEKELDLRDEKPTITPAQMLNFELPEEPKEEIPVPVEPQKDGYSEEELIARLLKLQEERASYTI